MHFNTKQQKSIIMAEMMTPNMANFSGNIHGGQLMYLLDKVAYACAVRYASIDMVTLSVDHIFFKEPIYVNDLVTFKASVNHVGNTSLEVGIRVEAENLETKQCRHTNTCYFTMVAVDKSGKPIQIPAFAPETEIEKRRHQEAQKRREYRITAYKKSKDADSERT